MSNKSRLAAIALFIAAVAILAGTLSKSWFTASRGDAGVGLSGVKICNHGECRTASWSDMPRVPSEVPLFGYLGLIGGVLAAAGCVATGGLLLANRRDKVMLKPLGAVLGVAALGQIAFVNRFMSGGGDKGVSIGWSMIVALAGLVAVAVISKALVTPLLQEAPPPAPAPAPQPYTIA